MTDLRPLTLEQRLSKMEVELQKANDRVRVQGLVAAGVAFLLIVFGWVVPTPAAQKETTLTVPFTVTGSHGSERLVVDENSAGSGLVMSFYNAANGLVLQTGVGPDHATGILIAQTPDGRSSSSLGIGQGGHPGIKFISSGIIRAAIGWGGAGMQFEVDSDSGRTLAQLEEDNGNGYFLLNDAQGVSTFEAGAGQKGGG
jgi:hypothetical protein